MLGHVYKQSSHGQKDGQRSAKLGAVSSLGLPWSESKTMYSTMHKAYSLTARGSLEDADCVTGSTGSLHVQVRAHPAESLCAQHEHNLGASTVASTTAQQMGAAADSHNACAL